MLESAKAVAAATKDLVSTTLAYYHTHSHDGTTRTDSEESIAWNNNEIDAPGLVGSARVLGEACNRLLTVTVDYQNERMGGGSNRKENVYHNDRTWSNGLVSAAQSVGGTITSLLLTQHTPLSNDWLLYHSEYPGSG